MAMPRTRKKIDPLVGESSFCQDFETGQPNSVSPLVHVSLGLSPQHTDESNEVAQINSSSTTDIHRHSFPVGSPEKHTHEIIPSFSPKVLPTKYVEPAVITFSNPHVQSPITGVNFSSAFPTHSTPKQKERIENWGKIADVRDKTVGNEDKAPVAHNEEYELEVDEEGKNHQNADIETSETKVCNRKDKVNFGVDRDPNHCSGMKRPHNCGQVPMPIINKEQIEKEACTVSGYMTLATRNGDSVVHGLLPSILSHSHGNTSFNTCLHGTDGNWYQILPVPAEPHSHSNTNLAQSSTSNFPVTSHQTSFNSAMTTSTTTTMSTIASAPNIASDSVVGFLQQYTATAGIDMQHSYQALRLPLSVGTAAPRYLYAAHPRTGQLVVVSSLGDLNAVSSLQQQPAPNQSQQQHVQLLQMSAFQCQQQQAKGKWKSPIQTAKSPLHTTEKQNTETTISFKEPSIPDSQICQEENMPPVAAAQELLALASPVCTRQSTLTTIPPPLYQSSPRTSSDEPVRENHNMKERRRRARIKDACDLMRQLVPGMSEKTDKATVFEFSARYIHFLKNFVGGHHDKDFLIKYSPY